MSETQVDFDASAKALNSLTTAAENHPESPIAHLHRPANHESTHSWLGKILPASTLNDLESRFHMGNYVIDRQTGEKSFEAMSIYVRLGMHLLYYGSEQEKALHWQRTLEILKDQSVKMGREYDTPESSAHIEPFIKSFDLHDSLADLVEPDPTKYATFNDFFAREIRESSRPIAQPDDEFLTSSPADCRLTAYPTVDLATEYWIKGEGFTISRLLTDPALATLFDGGSIVIARLALKIITAGTRRSRAQWRASKTFLAPTTPSIHKPSMSQGRWTSSVRIKDQSWFLSEILPDLQS